jgi:hypothetical protein
VKTLSSLQLTDLVKCFTVFFVLTTVLWATGNYIAIRDVLVSWPVFVVNVLLSAALGWWYYRYRYHTVFSYDATEFKLRVGRRETVERWDAYCQVSLVHGGRGDFFVRLYRDEGAAPVDIPASALKLDPQQFRFDVMGWALGSEEVAGR